MEMKVRSERGRTRMEMKSRMKNIVVREKLANIQDSLKRITVPGQAKIETQEMMEEYVTQCENAVKP